jgi:hypothetical protein
MNIFILDHDIQKCARYHCDKHVAKMILEATQILCTVCNQHGIKTPYRSTHKHHPCVLWTGQSIQNWRWLKRLADALNREFKYRYGHIQDHRAYQILKALKAPPLPNIGLTPFVQVMPSEYKVPGDAITAYRQYYIGMKHAFATWKRRRVPKWFVSNSVS